MKDAKRLGMRHVADIVLFKPRAELDAAANMRGFINSCRIDLTIFGSNLPFDENVWDLTESFDLKGWGKARFRLLFNKRSTANDAITKPMSEPFLSFSKAYCRYVHGFRPSRTGIGTRLYALRVLEAALSENGVIPDPIKIDLAIMNRAAQLITEHYCEKAAYNLGVELEILATFLSDNLLTVVPVRWYNSMKRPLTGVRVGKEFDDQRQKKMPSEAALDALPKVFRLATEPREVIISSIAAILCAAPDRISEIFMLPEKCEVFESRKDKEEVYGIRWWPRKGADPMVKWVVPAMTGVVKEAVAKIRQLTNQARCIAKWYEDHPTEIYLPESLEHLRNKEWLNSNELSKILGISDAWSWCRTMGIPICRESRQYKTLFADLELAVLRMLPRKFPILDPETGLKFSDALLVIRSYELVQKFGTSNCMVEPLTFNQVNNGLGNGITICAPSIFARFGFVDEIGSPIKVTSNQFRHYLNTLAQSGGMSQLDIARWSGRKNIHQNSNYDHVTPDQMLQKIRSAVGDNEKMFGPLAEMPKRVLIPRDEFARLMVPTAHTTDFGFCIHDYTMTPCQLHMDCINCDDLVCVKGDLEKTEKLRRRLAEARTMMEKAVEAIQNGYAGSDQWLVHHESVVKRLSQLFSIMNDPNIPQGSIVQLAPTIGIENKTGRLKKLAVKNDDEARLEQFLGSSYDKKKSKKFI
jgi:hypothetical protein